MLQTCEISLKQSLAATGSIEHHAMKKQKVNERVNENTMDWEFKLPFYNLCFGNDYYEETREGEGSGDAKQDDGDGGSDGQEKHENAEKKKKATSKKKKGGKKIQKKSKKKSTPRLLPLKEPLVPLIPNVLSYSLLLATSSLAAADAINENRAAVAINWLGGSTRAKKTMAGQGKLVRVSNQPDELSSPARRQLHQRRRVGPAAFVEDQAPRLVHFHGIRALQNGGGGTRARVWRRKRANRSLSRPSI